MRIVKKNKKLVVIIVSVLAAILIAGGIAAYFLYFNKSNNFEGTAGVSKVNYGPPTEQEKQAGNEQKEAVIEQDKLDNQKKTNTQADVVISDASYYSDDNMVEVRGYVTNVYENGGQCTATFTQGNQTVTQSSTAFEDAKTIQCGKLDIPRSKFPSGGTWNLTLTYSSSTAQGSKTASVKL